MKIHKETIARELQLLIDGANTKEQAVEEIAAYIRWRDKQCNRDVVSESTLIEHKLTIEYFDHGIYQLRQNGEYLMEGEKLECHRRAREIVEKYSR